MVTETLQTQKSQVELMRRRRLYEQLWFQEPISRAELHIEGIVIEQRLS